MLCKCGAETNILHETVGYNQNGTPITHRISVCPNCNNRIDFDLQNQINPPVKKESGLSTAACILSILGCTCLIGGILAIVDLCSNDNTKKHKGSWFAIIVCAIWFFIGATIVVGGSSGNEDVKIINNSKDVVEEVEEDKKTETQEDNVENSSNDGVVNIGGSFELDGLKVTVNNANVQFTEYEDEYGWYKPEEGMKYIKVSFTYENVGNTEKYVSIYDYDCYADGTLCEQTYNFGGDFINANISSGRNVSFDTYYIVPVNAQRIELEYKELISFEDNKIIIKVQ